jgi:hypothetical protein
MASASPRVGVPNERLDQLREESIPAVENRGEKMAKDKDGG